VTAAVARAAMARLLARHCVPRDLGEIRLASHQVAAARRIAELLREHGGALLADDVGLGKTYVALATAREYQRVLIIHPAALREMWETALCRTGVAATLGSYEAISRRALPAGQWDIVILDEAHHARSTSARRYRRIAALTAHARTLLISATPLVNRLDELRALLALFLGERAGALDAESARRYIVRRTADTVPGAQLPAIARPEWVHVADDPWILERILALPPPVPPADSGDGGTLHLIGLVRQWASSVGALRAALRRRLARATAMDALLAEGRNPTRHALAAWQLTDTSLQLAMPGLFTEVCADGAYAIPELARAVATHRDGIVALLDALDARPDPDALHAAALAGLRDRYRGERILAFTEYAETAQAYGRHLRQHPGIARLTARGGEIASGAIGRRDVLHRFAPRGSRRAPPRAAEAITLLVTTDLLAEGVDLRDATVVVHLDLPWNPARLEQRVGRARRLGASAERIAVHAFRPPHAAEALLELEARLRHKAALTRATVGAAADVLPEDRALDAPGTPGAREAQAGSHTERMSALVDRVAGWTAGHRAGDDAVAMPDGVRCAEATSQEAPLLAQVAAPTTGWLAVASIAGSRRLVAKVGGIIGDSPAVLGDAIRTAECGVDAPIPDRTHVALDEACRWAAEREAEACVAALPPSSRIGRRLLDRIGAIHVRMRPEERAATASLLATARSIATSPLTAGQQHDLEPLLAQPPRDPIEWLRTVAAVEPRRGAHAGGVEVLIAFGPSTGREQRELRGSHHGVTENTEGTENDRPAERRNTTRARRNTEDHEGHEGTAPQGRAVQRGLCFDALTAAG